MANENIVYRVVNKKSSVNGKLPTAEQLLYGEIAINYAVSSETISIKNSNDEIITFPSSRVTNGIAGEITEIQSAQTILEAEMEEIKSDISDIDLVSARAFNDLNDKLDTISSEVGDIVEGEGIVSGAVVTLNENVNTLSGNIIELSAVTIAEEERAISAETILNNTINTLSGAVEENEEVIANAFTNLNDRVFELENLNEDIKSLTNAVDENEEIIANALTNINDRLSSIEREIVELKQRITSLGG